MAQVRTAALGRAARGSRPVAPGARLARIVDAVLAWQQREFDRAAMASMSDHQLRDVGLTRAEVLRECAKPFWRA